MVTTNCVELTGKGDCKVPLSGNSAQEFQQNIFAHAKQHHAEELKKMSQQDQTKMTERIQQIYQQKSGAKASPAHN
jgi:predicted small metal-binding protein